MAVYMKAGLWQDASMCGTESEERILEVLQPMIRYGQDSATAIRPSRNPLHRFEITRSDENISAYSNADILQ
jgi:hypothetical protein